jgi:hypothetical protein
MAFIFIILRPVSMRLDRFFGQVFMRLSYYSIDMSPHNWIGHIVARHRWGEGNKTVQEDKDRGTYDWVLTRQKSSSSLIKHRSAPTRRRRHIRLSRWRPVYTWLSTVEAKVILIINTSCLHLTWRWCWLDFSNAKATLMHSTYNTSYILQRCAILYLKTWWPLHAA